MREREGGRSTIAEKAMYWVLYRLTDQETEGLIDGMEAN